MTSARKLKHIIQCKLNEIDRDLIALSKPYTGIHLENMPEKTRIKQTKELNLYIPEKWDY